MPGASEETLSRLENTIATIRPVSAMAKDGFSAWEIASEVLCGFSDIHILSETELAFRCQCSRNRTEDILATLRKEDLERLIEDGQAEVCCDFCGEKYHFTREDLLAIRERRRTE